MSMRRYIDGQNRRKLLVLIVSALLVVTSIVILAYFPSRPSGPVASKNPQYPESNSIYVVDPTSNATINTPYNFTIQSMSQFQSMTIYYGDGSSHQENYGGINRITLSHNYSAYGSYFIMIVAHYKSSPHNYSVLLRIDVSGGSVNQYRSTGFATILPYLSSNSTYLDSSLYAPGSHLGVMVSYLQPPLNSTYQVYGQNVVVYRNDTLYSSTNIPYKFDSTTGGYITSVKDCILNYSSLSSGLYQFEIRTFTGIVNSTGVVSNSSASGYFLDAAVSSGIPVFPIPQNSQSLTDAQFAPAGVGTFDTQIAYDAVSEEALYNTNQFLDMYKGSSSSQFEPMLASYLPTIGHGVNAHWHNYTRSYVNNAGIKITYNAVTAPGQNYTFQVRSNATWQDGTPVTAWDVKTSIARDLLFMQGSPQTPGWMLAQVLLPGGGYLSGPTNTYHNISDNITVNNATNSVTFHLQKPEAPQFIYVLFASSGAFITSAKWLTAHGAGLAWTPAGFRAYSTHDAPGVYFTYPETHIFSDGPYLMAYYLPAGEIVLRVNPHFVSPGPWYPAPTIKVIRILLFSRYVSPYLMLRYGGAQTGTIQISNWSYERQLHSLGLVNAYNATGMTPSWYQFNGNINTTLLTQMDASANVNASFFDNVYVRQTFAYAYNYQYYLDQQVGNSFYNLTLASQYAGMLPPPMLYGQTPAQLTAAGANVPDFNLTMAKHYWNMFLNSSNAKAMGIGSNGYYKGKMLDIPIFILGPDPADQAGALTWAENLSKVIFGTSAYYTQFPVEQTTFVQNTPNTAISYNPMPITISGWFPDYPYPTDLLQPVADPVNTSFYMASNGWLLSTIDNSSNLASYNASEVTAFHTLINDYENGSSTTSASTAKYYFQHMNEEFVNMSFDVYLSDPVNWEVWSVKIPGSQIIDNEQNVMSGQIGDYTYNLLRYTGNGSSSYAVTFNFNSTSTGSQWTVTITRNNETQVFSTVGPSISAEEINGTYAFTAYSENKTMIISPSHGNFTLRGSPVTISLNGSFIRSFTVNPPGAAANVEGAFVSTSMAPFTRIEDIEKPHDLHNDS
ncbi:MAG: ABC transporter substrate-binding protein [Thermoplasmataceae archaeon]